MSSTIRNTAQIAYSQRFLLGEKPPGVTEQIEGTSPVASFAYSGAATKQGRVTITATAYTTKATLWLNLPIKLSQYSEVEIEFVNFKLSTSQQALISFGAGLKLDENTKIEFGKETLARVKKSSTAGEETVRNIPGYDMGFRKTFKMVITKTSVKFYIDNMFGAELTTNIPLDAVLKPFVMIYNNETGGGNPKNLKIDEINIKLRD
ncbi:hypothetical protein [Paenibacillus urinalis]|uniref:hypothetical protein n=1 Tax=Paenibacillus urinalis TaxID=521520 RepID=UPI00195FB763